MSWDINRVQEEMGKADQHQIMSAHIWKRRGCVAARIVLCFLFLNSFIPASAVSAQAQSPQLSFTHLPSKHYSPRNSDLKYQTWSVIQDNRGITYIADEDGIKVFNGKNWSRILTKSGSTVRSLASSVDGKIYYGAQGEFGEIITDKAGSQFANSLTPLFSEYKRSFSDVWATHVIGDDVFYQSRGTIFVWNGTEIRTLNSEGFDPSIPKTGFHTSFVVSGVLYVREHGTGLKRIENYELVLVNGGEALANTRVYMMYQLEAGFILVGTQEQGLLRFGPRGFERIVSELDQFQKSHNRDGSLLRLYTASRISDDFFAIGTLGAGIVIVDQNGAIRSSIDSRDGLPDDWINNVFVAGDRTLWLALDNSGAALIDLLAPVVRYREESGVLGRINHISRLKDVLTISTGAGLFSLVNEKALITSAKESSTFDVLEGIGLPWMVYELEDENVAATGEGVKLFQSDFETSSLVSCSNDPALTVIRSQHLQKDLVGTKTGLMEINRSDTNCWLTTVGGVSAEIWSILEDGKDKIWLGTRHEGVVLLEIDSFIPGKTSRKSYSITDGLPQSSVTVSAVDDRPIFYSEFGPYRFIEEEDRFELDEELWPFEDGRSDSLFTMTEDHHGNVWMVFPDSVVKATPNSDGSYRFTAPEALKFRKTSTSSILVEDDDVVWFNDGDELIRYDPKLDLPAEFSYNALVSSVSVNGQPDAIHNGSFRGPNGGAVLDQPNWAIPTLNYDQKDLSFRVAATTYTAPDDIRFQIWLEGKDESWSKWSVQYEYYITGLHEGSYTFRVRARNTAGRLSREAGYSFVILPPWYRTWWAYFLYVTLGSLVVYSVQKYFLMWRAHKLAAEQAEELLREREVNKVLQEANERLTKANRLKDEFLATTSHELRTPLTAILGFTSVLREEIPDGAEYLEFLDIIEDSGSRLMETLNSLLDLAKLRANMMEINLEPCDLYYQCINGISDLEATAERKGLKLHVERPSETLFVDLDVLGFLRILQNLIGNAIKFTETGFVKVVLEADGDFVHMKICDSGIGIDEEFLPRLFDEFMQESDGPSRSYEGFGLGLAITVRLVRLMHGDLSVESKKGEGSQFTVTFPRAEPITGASISVKGFGNVDEQSW